MARSNTERADFVVSGKPFENINIFVQQPNNMSDGRSINGAGFLVCGFLCLVGGLWISDSVSAVINNCGMIGGIFLSDECAQARAVNGLGVLILLGGGVLLAVGCILLAKSRPSSEGQHVLIVGEDGKNLVNPTSTTAFCPKCGVPYSLGKSDSNFCPNCGNPFR
jgi:hypothetical protein